MFICFQEDFILKTKHMEFWEKDSKPYLVSLTLNIVFAGAISCYFSVTKKACPCSLYYLLMQSSIYKIDCGCVRDYS